MCAGDVRPEKQDEKLAPICWDGNDQSQRQSFSAIIMCRYWIRALLCTRDPRTSFLFSSPNPERRIELKTDKRSKNDMFFFFFFLTDFRVFCVLSRVPLGKVAKRKILGLNSHLHKRWRITVNFSWTSYRHVRFQRHRIVFVTFRDINTRCFDTETSHCSLNVRYALY